MKAKDVMTSPVVSVEPDDAVLQAVRMMLQRRVSGLNWSVIKRYSCRSVQRIVVETNSCCTRSVRKFSIDACRRPLRNR